LGHFVFKDQKQIIRIKILTLYFEGESESSLTSVYELVLQHGYSILVDRNQNQLLKAGQSIPQVEQCFVMVIIILLQLLKIL